MVGSSCERSFICPRKPNCLIDSAIAGTDAELSLAFRSYGIMSSVSKVRSFTCIWTKTAGCKHPREKTTFGGILALCQRGGRLPGVGAYPPTKTTAHTCPPYLLWVFPSYPSTNLAISEAKSDAPPIGSSCCLFSGCRCGELAECYQSQADHRLD